MTDLESTRLAAEAMGAEEVIIAPGNQMWITGESNTAYDPLHDDAQSMALVKRFKLNIGQLSIGMCKVFTPNMKYEADDGDLNYAIVLCVAKMQGDTSGGKDG